MQFYVEGYSNSHGIEEQSMDIFPHIKLLTDFFVDFGNQTLFIMYYRKNEKNPYKAIGKIKILNSNEYVVRKIIPIQFERLSKEFCSLGQSVEYYSRLRELNSSERELGREILVSLNDIAINTDIREKFPDQPGINTSLDRKSVV